jgi:NAD-dependent dihydropyrimidine dehydrogenase PreA subunit
MKEYRYIDGVATLKLDQDACVGCGECATVCPHRVFAINDRKAGIVDFDACIECGACARNCPAKAIAVRPGVGCASYIMAVWLARLTGNKVKTTCC